MPTVIKNGCSALQNTWGQGVSLTKDTQGCYNNMKYKSVV